MQETRLGATAHRSIPFGKVAHSRPQSPRSFWPVVGIDSNQGPEGSWALGTRMEGGCTLARRMDAWLSG